MGFSPKIFSKVWWEVGLELGGIWNFICGGEAMLGWGRARQNDKRAAGPWITESCSCGAVHISGNRAKLKITHILLVQPFGSIWMFYIPIILEWQAHPVFSVESFILQIPPSSKPVYCNPWPLYVYSVRSSPMGIEDMQETKPSTQFKTWTDVQKSKNEKKSDPFPETAQLLDHLLKTRPYCTRKRYISSLNTLSSSPNKQKLAF